MGALEPWHLVVILVIALIIFGPGKVADIGGTLGKGVKDFREAVEGRSPTPPPAPAAPAAVTSGDRHCSHCGASLAADAKFCPQCGTTVATPASAADPRVN
ncbi:MAG: twin-arginine translocase TatA/TatE family subunit [Chloroflexota bacterium]|nr:twin-arginine translocase TatA/TatE family subunit [Chloroflexota bacterium]